MKAPFVLLLSVLAWAGGVPAQNKVSVTQTYDGSSPEIAPGGWMTSDVIACRYGSPAVVVYPRPLFSLPPGGDLDAISDGSDVFPPIGPIGPVPPANGCRRLVVEFSVDRASVGHPVSVVASEAGPGGNGAAGDVFQVSTPFLPTSVVKVADGMCTSPNPTQSNVFDLAWVERTRYPVYFSIPPNVSMVVGGQTVMPADVLKIAAPGALPAFHMIGANIGLAAADDIDAIAVDNAGRVVFSLSRGSPTAQNIINGAVNSAGLWIALNPGGGTFAAWANAISLGLLPNPPGGTAPDDLDGVRITDPALFSDPITASGGGGPDGLAFDMLQGSTPRRVYLTAGTPSVVSLVPGSPATGFAIFAFMGIPGNGPLPACPVDEWPIPLPGFSGGLSFVPPLVGPSSAPTFLAWDALGLGIALFPPTPPPWPVPGLPPGLVVSLQGILTDTTAALGLRVTNLVTAVVE